MASRRIMSLIFVVAAAGIANGATYDFNGVSVAVEYWAGTGANEAIMVVDWQRDVSLAFGYRWGGSATAGDMFDAVDAASDRFYKEWVDGYGNGAIFGIGYDMDGDGFSKGDTGDYYQQGWFTGGFWAEYLSSNGQTWDWGSGLRVDNLSNESWVGFSWAPDFVSSQPNPPIVPEPTTLALLCLGGLLIKRKKRYGNS
ncbi:MAG: PEP-CTERM sorting domain-containing protein [Sedimentisphaerales bacterium]